MTNVTERLEMLMARRTAKVLNIEKQVDLNGWKTAYEPVGEF